MTGRPCFAPPPPVAVSFQRILVVLSPYVFLRVEPSSCLLPPPFHLYIDGILFHQQPISLVLRIRRHGWAKASPSGAMLRKASLDHVLYPPSFFPPIVTHSPPPPISLLHQPSSASPSSPPPSIAPLKSLCHCFTARLHLFVVGAWVLPPSRWSGRGEEGGGRGGGRWGWREGGGPPPIVRWEGRKEGRKEGRREE